MSICPMCEQKWSGWQRAEIDTRTYFKHLDIHLSGHEARIVAALIKTGRPLTHEYLHDVLWGDDADGGPLSVEQNIRTHICRIRAKLKKLTFGIQNIYGKGYFAHDTKSLPDFPPLNVMAYAVLIPLFLSFPVMALAQGLCEDRDKIETHMLEKYGETPRSIALTNANKPIQLFINDETESWTLIVYPDGARACIFASGTGWYDKTVNGDPLI